MTGVLKVDDIQDAGANSIVSSNGSGTLTFGSFSAPNITASTALLPDASDGAAIGSASLEWSDIFLADAAVINLGDDQDVTLTHVADTGILLNSSRKIQFGDSATFIHQSSDGVMTVDGEATIDLNASTAVLVSNDLKLDSDAAVLSFGADSEITLTHSADVGLILKHTATADDKPINLVLQTGETDMAANDVIGKISFQAPDEGTGTDAILISAAIQAVAEGDHSSSSNATRLEFMTGASEAAAEKMTLTSAGILNTTKLGVITDHDLGVGLHIRTADSGGTVDSAADELVIEGSVHNGITFLTGTSQTSTINFGDSGDNNIGILEYNHNTDNMHMYTNAALAMTIDSAGKVGVGGATNLSAGDSDNSVFQVGGSTHNTYAAHIFHSADPGSAAPYGLQITYTGGAPDSDSDSANLFIRCNDTSTQRFAVAGDGDVVNHDNSYGSSSDERIKDDIADASSQWNDIKAIKVRNFERKDDITQHGRGNHVQIGVIAQELEAASMGGLVNHSDPEAEHIVMSSAFGTLYEDGDSIPEGKAIGDVKTTTSEKVKSVKYSVLYMKAIKALQEAQTRIETLETKVQALEDA